MGNIVRYRITIKGRVQGVFFRENVKQRAEELGLRGWVKNKGIDMVEVIAEGEKIFLDKLYQYCKEGPKGAQILNVEVSKEEPSGEFDSFSIRY